MPKLIKEHNRRITIRISNDIMEALKERSKSEDKSVARIIRTAIRLHLSV